MKKLKQIFQLGNSTINSPNIMIQFLLSHYDIRDAHYLFMEESLTYIVFIRLTTWCKFKYIVFPKYRARVKVTLNEAVEEIPQEFRIITALEL